MTDDQDVETRCYFCEEPFLFDKHGMYREEVGEFWSEKLQHSVIAHPDCLPNGIDTVFLGEDPEWKMA